MLSYLSIEKLPDHIHFRKRAQAIAMLDAILMPDWEFRRYSFNSRWGKDEMMASMRDGEGSDYYALIFRGNIIIKGFDKNSKLAEFYSRNAKIWPGIYKNAPSVFNEFKKEVAFSIDEASFCIWKENNEPWKYGEVDLKLKNELRLLEIYVKNEKFYKKWADAYYETNIPINIIKMIYNHEPVSEAIIKKVNSKLSINDMESDIKEIGFPVHNESGRLG